MAFPIVPVAAVVAAAALLFGILKLKGGGGDLPPDLQGPFNDLMTRGTDPDAMDQVANALDAKGFKAQAAMLHAKASQLRGGQKPAPGPAPPPPAPGVTPPPAPTPPVPTPPPAPVAPAGPSLPAQFMKVTTNDPPPSGDLALRDNPSNSANVIGAAEKDSTVTVKNVSADGQFIQVEALNPAGRRQSMTGWAHAAFLVPTNPMKTSGRFDPRTHRSYGATIGGILCGAAMPAGGQMARCLSPASCALRQYPTHAAGIKALLPVNAQVQIDKTVPGWALVTEPQTGTQGWVPREGLV
jgi:hypothetical protein